MEKQNEKLETDLDAAKEQTKKRHNAIYYAGPRDLTDYKYRSAIPGAPDAKYPGVMSQWNNGVLLLDTQGTFRKREDAEKSVPFISFGKTVSIALGA